jgi:prolyl 4-hydroxylase
VEARARALQGWSFSRPSSTSFFEQYFFYGPSGQVHVPDGYPGGGSAAQAQGREGEAPQAKGEGGQQEGLMLERLKIQRYGPGGRYTYHYDWQGAGQVDRVSSFMVYVDANCTGGGTAFPRLPAPENRRWCRFIECDEVADQSIEGREAREGEGAGGKGAEGGVEKGGVIFKPIRGNAVYWENLRSDGTGYTETWHAGLPVLTGTKVGLNIWSWYRF